MKARVLALGGDEHRLAQELLPWFVNHTLGADEAAQVGAHVAQCSRCQADAAAQERLRSVAVDAGDPALPVEPAWVAMRARLDALPSEQPARASVRSWRRFGLPFVVATQAAAIFVLAVAWMGSLSRSETYRGLGGAPAAANAHVVFRPAATEAQMRAALRGTGARIVGGPTVTDAYLLQLGDAGPVALTRLREQPAVLRAESLQGEPAR